MTAVAVAPPQSGAQREVIQWLTPAPLWTEDAVGVAAGGLLQPWIAELTTDTFVDDFLVLLAGTGGASPAGLAALQPDTTVAQTGAFRLFQPLSQRYYLVTATLACRRPGIPDHAVQAGRGERVSFVLRRLDPDGTEHGFVPGTGAGRPGTWLPATATALVTGEREMPMHPAPVGAFAEPGTAAATLGMAAGEPSTRTVFYGYIPVASRDDAVLPLADPAAALAAVQATMSSPSPPENPTIDALVARVVQPWSGLLSAPPPPGQGSWPTYPSLYVILDLADWLATNLDPVFRAITEGTTVPKGSAADQLVQAITKINVRVGNPSGSVTLAQAIKDLVPFRPLVRGDGISGPSSTYDLTGESLPTGWLDPPKTSAGLAGLAAAALAEAGTPVTVPPELEGLIKDDPVPAGDPGASNGATYVIRTVFAHAPCRPVISEPTRSFELARALDPDAPARKILIQLPDISNMRRFRRGVAIEMSPGLRRLMDRVTPGLMKGDGLGSDPGAQLGMICSFSLQIVTLVAFIVMFIFLILLNIVFWWLPFLKVCFPVPVRPGNPKGPTP